VKTVTTLAANKLGRFLTREFRQNCRPTHDDGWAPRPLSAQHDWMPGKERCSIQ